MEPTTPDEGSRHSDPRVGMTIGAKYRIERVIGRGGMGIVYLARQDAKPTHVVVKMVAPEALAHPGAVPRFEREARSLQALRHSNIVEMFDFGRDGDRSYLVMEYLDGEALGDYIKRKGRLTLREFVPIAAQILKGVGFAHARDLVIRDIKPAHVMLCERGNRGNFVKLLDFGLAKVLNDDNPITVEFALGTVGFVPPETVGGAAPDLRVDVFALGVLFYLMLSGRMPQYKDALDGSSGEVVPLSETLGPDHGLPEALLSMVHKCFAQRPNDRPNDANAIVELLIDAVPSQMFRLPSLKELNGDSQRVGNPDTGVIEFDREVDQNAVSESLRVPATAPVGTHGLDAPITTEVYNKGRRGALMVGVLVGVLVAAAALFFVVLETESASAPPVRAEAEGSLEDLDGSNAPMLKDPESESSALAVGQEAAVPTDLPVELVAWSVTTEPEGAAVTIDGEEFGHTPVSEELAVGTHTLEIVAEGYETWSQEFEVGESPAPEPMRVTLSAKRARRGRRRPRRADSRENSPATASSAVSDTPATPPVSGPPEKRSVLLSGSARSDEGSPLLKGD